MTTAPDTPAEDGAADKAPVEIKIDVPADAVKDAAVSVLKEQMLAAMDREASVRASMNTLAQQYADAKTAWEADRETLLAQIRRYQEGTLAPPRKVRNRETLPGAPAKATPPRKQARKRSPRQR